MRKEFIESETRKEALEKAPWAAYLHKAFGGYLAFESYDDYKTHIEQI